MYFQALCFRMRRRTERGINSRRLQAPHTGNIQVSAFPYMKFCYFLLSVLIIYYFKVNFVITLFIKIKKYFSAVFIYPKAKLLRLRRAEGLYIYYHYHSHYRVFLLSELSNCFPLFAFAFFGLRFKSAAVPLFYTQTDKFNYDIKTP